MAQNFLGEILLVPYNFAPQGWALCQGQLMPISQNTALFSLLGTYFGGNGTSNFALPNLQSSVALCQGQGAGLGNYTQGQTGGETGVVLLNTQLPLHTHAIPAGNASGRQAVPGPAFALGNTGRGAAPAYGTTAEYTANPTTLSTAAIATTGSGIAHNNMQPYQVFNYIIALTGIFPPRS